MFIKDDTEVPVDPQPLEEDPSNWSNNRRDGRKAARGSLRPGCEGTD